MADMEHIENTGCITNNHIIFVERLCAAIDPVTKAADWSITYDDVLFLIDDDNTIGYDDDYFAKVKEFAADDDVKAVVHADSLEELAGKLGVDAGTLKQTVEDYNSACAAGKDDEFGKDAQYLKAYPEDGGFYAVYQRIGSWGTIGGAIVDEQQHVLDADGNVIPNVFAAGETATAQLFGDYYFGGFSLGLYTTAGRIAAEQAVAEIQQ